MRLGPGTMNLKPMLEYEAVQVWLDGLRRHWDADPLQEDPTSVEALELFCRFVGKDPDTLIGECLVRKEGQTSLSHKRRRFYYDKITEFQESLDREPRDRVKAGNHVRSFFIHNGVFMQSGMQLG